MPPPHAARGVRGEQTPTAALSTQRSSYPHQTPPSSDDARSASSPRACSAVDVQVFLSSSDLVISGDLMVGSPSCSSPLPTHNDGTGRGPMHPKRPAIENQSMRWLLQVSHDDDSWRRRMHPPGQSLISSLRGLLRASVRQTTSCSSLEDRLTYDLYRKPRRESVPPSWARFPSWAGTSSRAARDGCMKSGPLFECLDWAGRRPAVIDAIPALDGIIFRNNLGWVLMTAGYPPP